MPKSVSAAVKKKPRSKKVSPALTTAQRLGALIKCARQIMRKDKGLNGDLDRLPLFTWILFLKFLDDMELAGEQEAKLAGKKYTHVITAPYRWRDWAAQSEGITGPDLLKFISQDETTRPDGTKGPGLFAYLRGLSSESGKARPDVIANVFKGVSNRMESGYLLRDVINKVSGIHFTASEEMHTLSRLYENMLREMRDAAGDSGEFYTPRPVVKFMVDVTKPRLAETVLDPACGTGGFLVEAYDHLAAVCKSVLDRRVLQRETLHGQEAKPLPYMLVQMNLLLHGLEYPNIKYGNTLAQKVTEIGDSDRVDVILTNPPFGGEEERGILNNFPADKQTAETALLFLQYIMRKLRRPVRGQAPGRAAVVVPNGMLFGDGVCARIKEELLKDFSLHTIVRLPEGTFAPYTDIPANILFFDRSGPTKTIWYYQVALPQGRKKYTKTMPMQIEDMAACHQWFIAAKRESNERAWRVDFGGLRDQAVAAATPHWEAATATADRIRKLVRDVASIEDQLQEAPEAKRTKLREQLARLEAEIAAERKSQTDEQVAGDELYWPIFNLDARNPNRVEAIDHRPPQELVTEIVTEERGILQLMEDMTSELESLINVAHCGAIQRVPMRELVTWRLPDTIVVQSEAYTFAGVYSFGRGVFRKGAVAGMDFAYGRLTRLRAGEFTYPKLMAWEGALGVVPEDCDGCYVSPEFPVFTVHEDKVLPAVLDLHFKTPAVWKDLAALSPGTNLRRRRLNPSEFLRYQFPLPPMDVQRKIETLAKRVEEIRRQRAAVETLHAALLPSLLKQIFNR
jgi:type I restriction enzyme M protein